MQLCLVRHAIAVERSSAFVDDRARPLTPEGRKRMAEAAAGLKKLFPASEILSSPLLRARQTAEILSDCYGAKVRLLDGLGNGDHFAALNGCRSVRDGAILVGHEPWMSELLSLMLTGNATEVAVVFKKGAAACVSLEGGIAPGAGVLEWMAQPAMLRRLG